VPQISFIVPLYNHLTETREMLSSLQASLPAQLNYEIILVDDGSTDGTRDWLHGLTQDTRIRVHYNEQNLGYAAANNAGARLAQGAILGLLNSDLLFDKGWLEPMLHILRAPDTKAGLVGNVQHRVTDGKIDHAGVELTPEGMLHHITQLPKKSTVKTLAVTGACVMLHKADFAAVGEFDTSYINGCEDVDLCFKLRAAKKHIYLATDSKIRHHVSLSRKTNTQRDLQNSRQLFGRWRTELKRELSRLWHDLLLAGPQAYASTLSGELDNDFINTPHAASQVIAEAMLQRQEAFWARELDGQGKPETSMAS
jgi:GT2 family glycosyltransferase